MLDPVRKIWKIRWENLMTVFIILTNYLSERLFHPTKLRFSTSLVFGQAFSLIPFCRNSSLALSLSLASSNE